ncbi:hypothetical protein [Acetobacter malorum]|uniref:hypothetical protein n=1 Tax=Acetobacter malorum TaxID=178901 RepID=UPI0039E74A61
MTETSALRPINHLGMETDEIDRLFSLIPEQFGENWLKQQCQRPLGRLWARRDGLASTELLILACALDWAKTAHPIWLKGQIKIIKGRDSNNSRGAMLELLALYLIRESGTNVAPTPKNTAGYDAIITFDDGAAVPLSVKDYGMSQHERIFQGHSKKFDAAFKARIKSQKRNGLCVLVRASSYPSEEDWKELHARLDEILSQPVNGKRANEFGIWSTNLTSPQLDVYPLSSQKISHQVSVIVPFHRNEVSNLEAKLEVAAANASKFAKYGSDALHAIFIRIPEWFGMQIAASWIKNYFERYPHGPIRFVLLYQAQTARMGDGTVLQHVFHTEAAASIVGWLAEGRVICMNVPIGVISQKGSPFQIVADNQPLNECYIYQKGDFYTSVFPDSDGNWHGGVRCIAPGIIQHSIFEKLNGHFQVSGKFPPSEEITLFG